MKCPKDLQPDETEKLRNLEIEKCTAGEASECHETGIRGHRGGDSNCS